MAMSKRAALIVGFTMISILIYLVFFSTFPKPQSKTWIPLSTGLPGKNELQSLSYRVARSTSHGKSVIIVIVDDSYVEMFLNFAESAKAVGLHNILPIALSQTTKILLAGAGYPSYYMNGYDQLAKTEDKFLSAGFLRKGAVKFVMTNKLLKLGYSVLLCDLDVFFARDPYPYFKCHDCDFEIGWNTIYKTAGACVGFIFFRAMSHNINFLNKMNGIMEKSTNLWDQAVFNRLMKTSKEQKEIKFNMLSYDLFADGFLIDKDRINIHEYDIKKVVVFHNNWSFGLARKRYRAKELGAWLLDKNKYYSSTTRRYVTYDNPWEDLAQLENSSLNTAIKVAKLLNRTLILPTFRCPQDTTRICPFDQVRDIEKFDELYKDAYREHRFLTNPKVPEIVKQSQSKPLAISTRETKRRLFAMRPTVVLSTKAEGKGPDAQEVLDLCTNYDSFSVIRFHSMYFSII